MLFPGRVALSNSSLSIFEMLIRPCGKTDAAEDRMEGMETQMGGCRMMYGNEMFHL